MSKLSNEEITRRNKWAFYFLILFCVSGMCAGAYAHVHLEKEYQMYWAKGNNAATEVVLDDKARVDCITNEYAVEVDFASKWAESIGQALYYSIKTNKKPAVLLIIEDPEKDLKYVKRLKTVADKYNIQVFTITKEELEK